MALESHAIVWKEAKVVATYPHYHQRCFVESRYIRTEARTIKRNKGPQWYPPVIVLSQCCNFYFLFNLYFASHCYHSVLLTPIIVSTTNEDPVTIGSKCLVITFDNWQLSLDFWLMKFPISNRMHALIFLSYLYFSHTPVTPTTLLKRLFLQLAASSYLCPSAPMSHIYTRGPALPLHCMYTVILAT